MKKTSFALLLAGFLFSACTSKKTESKTKENIQITKSTVGIDVRTGMELKANSAPGATHIPIGDLESATSLPEDKDAQILVFCESGGRAKRAKEVLTAKGYTNVKNISDWRSWNELNKK